MPGSIQTALHLAPAEAALAVDPRREFGELRALPAALTATAPICDAFHVALLWFLSTPLGRGRTGGSSLRISAFRQKRSCVKDSAVWYVSFSTCVELAEFGSVEPMKEKRFWSPKQAADHLSIAVQTLYAYCREPKNGSVTKLIGPPPPFRRFGRHCLRFPITEFIAWAETWDQPGEKKDV